MSDSKYQLELCEDCGHPLSDCGEIGIDGCPTADCRVCQLQSDIAALQSGMRESMRFKAKFSGITDLEPRKNQIEIVAIEDHQAIVSVLLKALEEGVKLYGKPGGPWNMPSQPGSWIEMARNAIAKAKGGAE